MSRRTHVQAATTSAVSWTIFEGDEFEIETIAIHWGGTGPTTEETIEIIHDSGQGTAYDYPIYSITIPAGTLDFEIRNITGFDFGDKCLVTYTNTDGVSITGTSAVLLSPDVVEGEFAAYIDGNKQEDTDNFPNVVGADGAAGPSMTMSIGGTQATGELEEIRVDSDGHPQVDVLTLPGGLTGYAEDAAHTTADIGIQMLSVRQDTVATTTDADGDYQPLSTDANGRLHTLDQYTGTIAGDTTSLDAKVPAQGTAVMTGSLPMTLATDDTLTVAANALLTTIDADTSSIATDASTIAGDTTSIDAKTPALGTAAMAASSPVTIATDDTLTVAANALLTTIDADTSSMDALLTTIDADTSSIATDASTIAGDTTSLDAKQPALGTAVMTGSSPVTLATDDTLTVAANALLTTIDADTSSIATDASTIAGDTTSMDALLTTIDADTSSMATDLSTVAGDTTSLDAKQPALGTAAMAASSPVTIASDDTLTTAANALLTTIDADTSSIATDASTISGATVSIASDTSVIAGDTTSLDAKQPALGTAAMAASSPVTLASDDTLTVAANALLTTIDADTSSMATDLSTVAGDTTSMDALLATIDADTSSMATDLSTVAGDTTSMDAKIPALGTAVMTGSSPVTIATDDTMFAALDAAVDIVAGDTTSIDGKITACNTGAVAGDVSVTTLKPDGTNTMPSLDAVGRAGFVKITGGTNTALVTATGADGSTNTINGLRTASHSKMFNGATWDRVRGDTTNGLLVNLGSNNDVTVTASARSVEIETDGESGEVMNVTSTESGAFDLKAVTCHFDGALAVGETITVSLDAADGAAYDVPIDVYDLGTAAEVEYALLLDVPFPCKSGDQINVSMSANANSRTYGLRIVTDAR